jgi:hypothetical protein
MNVRVGGDLYNSPKNNFGPVVGFAWQPNRFESKLVLRGGFGISYNQNEIAITANGVGNPPNAVQKGFTCPYPFTDPTCAGTGILYQTATDIHSLFGYAPNPDAITSFGSNNLPTSGLNFVTGFPANPKSITVYHYSFDMQYELPFNSVMMIGYQGQESRHLLTQNNLNVLAAARGIPLNPLFNAVDYYENAANGNYNALVTSLNHRFSHTFQAEAQYTWSKAMDEGSGPYEEDPYAYNTHLAYGRSDYNVTDAFKLFGLWQPTIFHGSNSWAEKILGGWSLSGIWNWNSGFPWNPVYNTAGVYYQGSFYGALRPASVVSGYGSGTANEDFMGTTNPNFHGNATSYFLPPSYVIGPTFPAFGAVPAPGIRRNTLNGPNYFDVDASLSKAFGVPNNRVLGENARFEIRADFYNIFNKLNLDLTSIDPTLGFVAPDGTVTPNSDFGVIHKALGSRTIQLQARFSF